MAEEQKEELTEQDILNRAFQEAKGTGESVKFSLGETKLVVDKELHVGFEDPKKALSSPSALKDLSAAANAADELRKTTSRGPG
jgi:hypothetical protein